MNSDHLKKMYSVKFKRDPVGHILFLFCIYAVQLLKKNIIIKMSCFFIFFIHTVSSKCYMVKYINYTLLVQAVYKGGQPLLTALLFDK